jgi:hypothetical protein
MAGKIQNEDLKSSAELAAAGATDASLPNDNKVYVATYSKRLDQAISAGDILGTAHSSSTTAHGATGAVVGTTNSQVITNKDIDGGTASNTRRITIPKDTKANLDALTRKQATVVYASDELKAYIDDGSNLTAIGTGSGGVNFINSQISEGATITGVATYADAAGTAPVDGTGGSPTSTIAVSTDSSLVGTKNLLWTKPAANEQGEGFSINFSIDAAFQSKPCTISAFYKVNSGTYASGDMTVWVFDVTNSQIIQPSAYSILNNTGVGEIKCEFQSNSNSTSYRLIFHTSTTSASAYTLRFDSFSVSPNTYNRGAGISEEQSYTPASYNGIGTPSAVNLSWIRSGGDLLISGSLTAGTVSAAEVRIALPTGLVVSDDSNRVASVGKVVGTVVWNGSGVNGTGTVIVNQGLTYIQFGLQNSTTNAALTPQNGTVWASSTTIAFTARVPIKGWGTSQVLSSDTDTRIVDFSAYLSANQAVTANTTTIKFDNVYKDSHGAWNVSTGIYTIPCAGDYEIGGVGLASGAAGAMYPKVNGSTSYPYIAPLNTTNVGGGKVLIPNLKAGDTLDFRSDTSHTISGGVTSAGAALSHINIKRASGPAQIAASEKIFAMYDISTTSLAVTLDSPINLDRKIRDTHGAVVTGAGTWKFTAPRADTYRISGNIRTNATTAACYMLKNGTYKYFFPQLGNSGSGQNYASTTSAEIPLLAGEYISFCTDASITLSGSDTTYTQSFVSISAG